MTSENVRGTRTESTHAQNDDVLRARWSEGLEIKMCLIAGVRGQPVFAVRSSQLQADKQVICWDPSSWSRRVQAQELQFGVTAAVKGGKECVELLLS